MVKHKPTPPAQLHVPRFVLALNRLAEEAGFSTEVGIGKLWDSDKTPRILMRWRGPRKVFERLQFVPPSTRRVVTTVGANISWPDSNELHHPIIYGYAELSRQGLEVRLSGGPPPKAIRVQGDVEIVEYPDETAYHGTKQALIAAGICHEKQFPDKHWSKSFHVRLGSDRDWRTKRYPDGTFLHWLQTEAAHKRRRAEEEKEERQWQCSGPAPTAQSNQRGDVDISSIDGYRRMFEYGLGFRTDVLTDRLSAIGMVKSADGHIYGVSRESQERINEAIEDLDAEIRRAEVYRKKYDARTEEEKEAARRLLASAEHNPAFQSFLSRLNLKR